MRGLGSALLTLALLVSAPPSLSAAPFGWENGDSRPFSFAVVPEGGAYEFWLAGFGAHTFETPTECCSAVLAPLLAERSASLRFWGLTYNGLHISSEFYDGIDLAHFFTAAGTFHSLAGSIQLDWVDYESQIQTVEFSIFEPGQVPEPAAMLLIGGGIGAVLWRRLRRRG